MIRLAFLPLASTCLALIASIATTVEAQGFNWQMELDDNKPDYGRVHNKRSIGGFGSVGDDVIGGTHDVTGRNSGRFVSIREAPPKRVEARQHGKVVLECSAAGTPAPQITWYKDGTPLFKDGKHKVHGRRHGLGGLSAPDVVESTGHSKSKVTMECLDQEDAGLYECVATNGGFSRTQTVATQVDVVSYDMGADCNSRSAEASSPIINQWMDTYMQMIGMDALLLCRAAGPHETYWTTPNKQIVDLKSEKYQMTSSGDLIVRNLSFEDMGMFRCTVKTASGFDIKQTFVYPLAVS